jgi:hypothetical protein
MSMKASSSGRDAARTNAAVAESSASAAGPDAAVASSDR